MSSTPTKVTDATGASLLGETKSSAHSETTNSPSTASNRCPPPTSCDTQGESLPPKEATDEDGQATASAAKPFLSRGVDASLSESSPRLVFVWNPYGVRLTADDGVLLSPCHHPTASSSSVEVTRLGSVPVTKTDEGRAYKSANIKPHTTTTTTTPAPAQARPYQYGHMTPSQQPSRGTAGQSAMSLAASGSSPSAHREADCGANRLVSPSSGLRRVEFYMDDCRQYYLDYSPTASSASCGMSMTLMPPLALPPRKDCVDRPRIRACMTQPAIRATAYAPSAEAPLATPQTQPQPTNGGPASISHDVLATTNATSTSTTEKHTMSAPSSVTLRGVSTWPQTASPFDTTGCDAAGLREVASTQYTSITQPWLAMSALSSPLLQLEEDTTAAMLEQITTQPSYFLQRFLPPPPSVPTMRQTMSLEVVRAACYRWFEHVRALTASGTLAMQSERQGEEMEGKVVTSPLPCHDAMDDNELAKWYDQAVTWWSTMSGLDEEYIRVPARSVMAALSTVSAATAAGVPVTLYDGNSQHGGRGGAAAQGASHPRGGNRRVLSSEYGFYEEYKVGQAVRMVRPSAEGYYTGHAYRRNYGANQPYPAGLSFTGLQRCPYSPYAETRVVDKFDTSVNPPL